MSADRTLPERKMADYDMSIHTNPDAMAWTKFFRECNPDCNVDDAVMLGWFANAMMAMHDHMRPDLAPVAMPDGSACFVADILTDSNGRQWQIISAAEASMLRSGTMVAPPSPGQRMERNNR